MGPADLSHAHGRRRAERRAGHHRAHAAIRPGRGLASDVGHADRHEHALRRASRQDPHAPDHIPRSSSTARRSCVSISSANATAWRVAALQEILEDFKDDTQVAQDLQPTLQKLRVMYAQQMLDELGLRREGGQHALVQKILKQFPTEDVPGEILQTVRQVQEDYKAIRGEAEGHRQGLPGLAAAGATAGRPRGAGHGAGRDGAGVETRNAAPHGGVPAEPERPATQARGETLAGRQRLVAGVRRRLHRFAGDPIGMAAAGHGAEVLDGDGKGKTRSAVAIDPLGSRRQAGSAGRAGRPHDAAVPIARRRSTRTSPATRSWKSA